MKNKEHEDIQGLEKLINLPFHPARVRWERSAPAQGGNWSLDAMLWFTIDDANAIANQSKRLPGPVKLRRKVAQWLPSPLRERYSDGASDDVLVPVDGIAIEQTLFANPQKSRLLNGAALVLPEQGIVYLSLYTI